MRATAEGAQKTGIYPFVSYNIVPGKGVLVRSAMHRNQLMKEHGLEDARAWSTESIKTKRRRHREEVKDKKSEDIKDIWCKVRQGKIDTRKARLAIQKMEYERRNGRV